MKANTKIAIFIINILLCAAVVLEMALMMYGWGLFVKILCYGIAAVGLVFDIAVFVLDREALLKTCFLVLLCTAVVVRELPALGINPSTGEWGMLVYVLIQILQVVVLPLPAAVCYIPGSLIWGGLTSTLLASAGVIIGSLIAYAIGRFFGKRAAEWIAGKEAVEKYAKFIGNKGKVIFLLMQILPFFPDDILCIVAGLTSMNFAFFIVTIVVVRPVIIALYCFLGTGSIIPFGGWGIPVWIAIFAVCIVLAVLALKYQDRFEKWLVSKFRKKDKK